MSLTMIKQNQVTTMSSREIAELTGKRHSDVKRDIKVMMEQLNLDVSKFAQTYLDGSKRQQTEYALPRRECEILVTGYDVKRRAAVIDRWFELESTKAIPVTGNPLLDALVQTQLQLNQQQVAIEETKQSAQDIASKVADTNQTVAKLSKSIEKVNVPKRGYITAGEAVRTIFPEVSKGALVTMLARYGSKGVSYTYFVEDATDKVGTTLQYPIKDVKAIRKDVMAHAVQTSPKFWSHPLNARFGLNK